MNIGLLDIDSHNFPNLALMKISKYHKNNGDRVEWINHFNRYDIVYKSKVFTFTKDETHYIHSDIILQGGTGYDCTIKLHKHIDEFCPDYSLYPKFKEAYGFLTRGCNNNCKWCIVPRKEGTITPYMDIEEFLDGRKQAILMDNNVLQSEYGLMQIEKIIRLGIKIDFNQGLDARIIAENKNVAKLLSKVKWIRFLRLACDTKSQMPYIEKALASLNELGFPNYKVFVYALIKDIKDALVRIEFLRSLNLNVFAQPYRDFAINYIDPEAKRLARYVNHKAIFKTVEYKNYHL